MPSFADLWPEDPLPVHSVRLRDDEVATVVLPPKPAARQPIDSARVRAMNELGWALCTKPCTCHRWRGICAACKARRITRRWPLVRRGKAKR